MHRRISLKRNIRVAFILYAAFLVAYVSSGVGVFALLTVEDFLLPVGAFSCGVRKTREKFVWLTIFILLGFLVRAVAGGDLMEMGMSSFLLIPYFIGGYFYRKEKSKWQLFVGVMLGNLIILSIPYISLPFYSSLVEQSTMELFDTQSLSAFQVMILDWAQKGAVYWSFAFEVFEKVIVGYFVLKVYLKFTKEPDYTLDVSFFHRKYGEIVMYAFSACVFPVILGFRGFFEYAVLMFVMYFFLTGATVIFEQGRLAKVLKRSVFRIYFPYIWVGMLLFVSFEVSFAVIVLTVIYSAYIATIGKHNISRLISDTIKRIKGD